MSVSKKFPASLPGVHLKETEDNEAVVSTVIDLYKLITTKHLPAVQGWVQVGTDVQASDTYTSTCVVCRHCVRLVFSVYAGFHQVGG